MIINKEKNYIREFWVKLPTAGLVGVAPSADLAEVITVAVASSADLAGDVNAGAASSADLAEVITVDVASSADLAGYVTAGVMSLANIAEVVTAGMTPSADYDGDVTAGVTYIEECGERYVVRSDYVDNYDDYHYDCQFDDCPDYYNNMSICIKDLGPMCNTV